jgi:hypothetical protein
MRKAVKGNIYDLVEPHQCSGEVANIDIQNNVPRGDRPLPAHLDNIFNQFKFVQKINELNTQKDSSPNYTGDKRSPEHTRKELKTTSAPSGILNALKSNPHSQPASDISEEPDDD